MLWLLIGYMWLFVHRPFEVWPALGDMHLERIYMAGTLLALLVYSRKRWVPNPQHMAYFAFAAAALFCLVASPWADVGAETVENYFKILVFYVCIVLVVHDEQSFRRLLLAFLVVMTLYMLHSLREYKAGHHAFRMGIARMIGVDKSQGDPNSFGASIVFALPFVVPFWLDRPSRKMRCFLVGYVLLSMVCIGLTGSRSSFVGLLLAGFLVVMRSRWRWRLIIVALLCAPIGWMALPPSLQNRFETIIHPEVGPANAIVSGQDRLIGLQLGFQLWGQFPLSGCGPGAWRPATGMPIESHNLYGQLVGEMGTLGLVAFLAILACYWMNLRWLRKAYRANPHWGKDFLSHSTQAIATGVLLLLFEGNFGHNLFRYSWLWYGGFLTIARYCVQQRWLAEAAGAWDWPAEPEAQPGYAYLAPSGAGH